MQTIMQLFAFNKYLDQMIYYCSVYSVWLSLFIYHGYM